MAAAEDRAPGVVKLMRKGNPFLEEQIQTNIAEIQEKAKQICLITHGRNAEFEKLGIEINRAAKLLSSEDLFSIQESVSVIASQLEQLCKILPDNTKNLACKTVKEMQLTKDIPNKLDKMELALAYICTAVDYPPISKIS